MSAYPGRPRRSGIRLDPDRLDFELGLRGLTARRFSQFANVHEVTLSRARHGHPVAERTLGRITQALLEIPPLAGADLLLAEPETKKPPSYARSDSGDTPSTQSEAKEKTNGKTDTSTRNRSGDTRMVG